MVKEIEENLRVACRSGDYRTLDPLSRETCIRMFRNQHWEFPESLVIDQLTRAPRQELTLWKSVEIFVNYPGIAECKALERYMFALNHIVAYFGKEAIMKNISIPLLQQYQIRRLKDRAAADTVNREFSTFSKLFGVLIESECVMSNPCRLVKGLSNKEGMRQVYLALADVKRIATRCPDWYQPVIWTGYYTGMRRGEILGLTWSKVNVAKRMIYLGPKDTKEGNWKRVPIHVNLVPIFEAALKVRILNSDLVFLMRDSKGIRPPSIEGAKNPWP